MSDRTSAALFSDLFQHLADGKPLIASDLWDASKDYDFSPNQMDCDDELVKLGLARVDTDENGEECIVYKGEREW